MHPAERFNAPMTMTAGQPLAAVLDRQAVVLLAESFAAVVPGFDPARFRARANRGLADLGLMDRAAHLAAALAEQLPADFPTAAPLVIASLGPCLTRTRGNGLRGFFYLPHSHYLATYGLADPAWTLRACRELTRRFTAEFALRPVLAAAPEFCLAELTNWVSDPDPHVRRAVSEATRPRLPWAARLPEFQRDPRPVLPLLERLVDDPDLYVRRSVANHLGDIAKDHPELAFATCRTWLTLQPSVERRWVVRHAVRHPAQRGVQAAIVLREDAGGRRG